jgi:IclR family KDG regulon transcriptional repressor
MPDDSDIVIADDGRRLRPVKSVWRAIDLLDVLGADEEPMGVTELAAAMRCSKTAAYNLITTLELRGLVRKDADNRYALGWRLLELGEIVRNSSTFGEAARARVAGLAELAGETAVLAVLDNNTVFCVEMAESRRSVSIGFTPGHRARLDANAAGRVLMAHTSAGRRRRYVEDRDPDGSTGLAETLERIRVAGFDAVASSVDEGLVSIAAPVFDYTREAVAGLAVIGPASRLTDDRVDELALIVRREADGISRMLGSTATYPVALDSA